MWKWLEFEKSLNSLRHLDTINNTDEKNAPNQTETHSTQSTQSTQIVSDKIVIGFRPADWPRNGHGVEQQTM